MTQHLHSLCTFPVALRSYTPNLSGFLVRIQPALAESHSFRGTSDRIHTANIFRSADMRVGHVWPPQFALGH